MVDRHTVSRLAQPSKSVLVSEQIADSIWEIWRSSRNVSSPVSAGEVTPEQYWILRLLYLQGSQRIKDIATRIGTTPSPVTISIKRLERQNLLKRTRSNKDERVVTVELTRFGRSQFESWRERRRRSLSKMFDALSEEEKTILFKLLSKVNVAIGKV